MLTTVKELLQTFSPIIGHMIKIFSKKLVTDKIKALLPKKNFVLKDLN